MKKRLTDTEIWDKPWFRQLSPTDKCAIIFIKDKCDNVGVWIPDKELAEFYIGGKVNWEGLPDRCNANIQILDNNKWWLRDFCEFQYGDLVDTCVPHKSYIALLKRHGLYDVVMKGYAKGMVNPKEKEKERDKEKEKEKEYAPTVSMKESEYDELCTKFGKRKIDCFIEKISDWQLSNGKRKKSMPATIKNWMRREAGVDSVKDLELKVPAKCPQCGKSWENEIHNNKSNCMGCDYPIKNKGSP